MAATLRSILARLKSPMTTVATLLMLGAVGYYGHTTHWSLPHLAASEHELIPDETEPKLVAESPGTVSFPTLEAVQKAELGYAKVEQRKISAHVHANGTISYNQMLVARISSRVSGVVWRVEKPWGSVVKKGDVLAIIEAPEVGRLKSEFMQNMVLNDKREDVIRRLTSAGSAVPEKQLREAEFELREAKLRLLNSEQTLINLGLRVRVSEVNDIPDEDLMKQMHFIGLPPKIIEKLDATSTTSSLLPIIAPFDGVVVGRDLGLGESVEPSKALFEIADVRTMWLQLEVRMEDAAGISLGDGVRFRAGGIDRELTGRVSWMSTEADRETRTVQIRAEVENPILEMDSNGFEHRLLRANMFGTGSITTHEVAQATVVPNACLHRDDKGLFVFVKATDKSFKMCRVRSGIVDSNFTEIHTVDGEQVLLPDTVLAAQGSHVLKSQTVLTRLEGGH